MISPTRVPSPSIIEKLPALPAVQSANGEKAAQIRDRMAHSEDEFQTFEDKCKFLYDLNLECNCDCKYLDPVSLKYKENAKGSCEKI